MDLNKEIILENKRLRLESLKAEHLEDLLPVALAYPDLLQYSPSPFGTAENLKTYFKMAMEGRSSGNRYPFVIWDKETGKYIGSTSFGNISTKNQRLEIGWTWLAKEAQGTGLNRYMKQLMLEYVFEVLDFERVELKTDARNLQSRRAIEKIGASMEGTLRSHTLMLDGHRRDTVYYSILKGEWNGINESIFAGIG